MTLLSLTVAALLSQTEAPPAERAAAAAERAAASAERAAIAAEKSAEAAMKIAAAAPAGPVVVVAPVAVNPEEKKNEWNGMVGVGVIALFGNAESLSATLNGSADKTLGAWLVGFRATGAYGQARAPGATEDSVTALRAQVTARVDRSIVSFASVYALAGAE